MAHVDLGLTQIGFGRTARLDRWWIQPSLTFIGVSLFVIYATWAALQGTHYTFGPYLSPFYSPELFGDSPHAWFGPKPGAWPAWLPFSPAMLILPFPGLFRFTCYYYRGAYYKAFWMDPVSCTVGEPRKTYLGEKTFPLILQNVHRYFLYFAIIFVFILLYDGYRSLWFTGADGVKHFGVGVGSLVLILNPILLGGYTFGCHSLRHLVGGVKDVLSGSPIRKNAYDCVSCLNRSH